MRVKLSERLRAEQVRAREASGALCGDPEAGADDRLSEQSQDA
jgi:hypothetical protein